MHAHPEGPQPPPLLLTVLPGPGRKRAACPYFYRLVYRGDDPGPGCVMIWEVSGGRLAYQVALERDEAGTLRLHCTCADAVYRAEQEGRFCKHVRGLLDLGRSTRAAGRVAGTQAEGYLPAG